MENGSLLKDEGEKNELTPFPEYKSMFHLKRYNIMECMFTPQESVNAQNRGQIAKLHSLSHDFIFSYKIMKYT